MISIDRDSSLPAFEQLVQQLRFQIASGRYKVGDVLPSTRVLAKQIGLSFHTVRKAFQELERQGLLSSRVGSGYRVLERAPMGRADRMEQGAAVVQETIQKLVGLGLKETEIDYLFQEQLTFQDRLSENPKILFTGFYRELVEAGAAQASAVLQTLVEAVPLNQLRRHQDADQVIVPYAAFREAKETLPHTDMLGVLVYLSPQALELIARLLPSETLGLVCLYPDAIEPVMQEVQHQTRFAGQILATSIDGKNGPLGAFLDQADLVAYTPQAKRKLQPLLASRRHTQLTPVVSPDSLDFVRQSIG